MATGSGKTLLLHLNYRQFLHYNQKPLDNVLLITPNEGLTQQHIDELQASNIPASRFNLDEPGGLLGGDETIKVTEITKLVMEKRGEGDSVPVEAFEGNNLIFVDEGHKGSGGEAWRRVRDALGETGFTFEYSATFGQALAAANRDELIAEYGKAIAFDYSYRHFYNDGYGKDFRVLNLLQETTADQTDMLLLARHALLLRAATGLRGAGRATAALQPGPPALDVRRRQRQRRVQGEWQTEKRHPDRGAVPPSRAQRPPPEWKRLAWEVLEGRSGLTDAEDKDIFTDRFGYLRSHATDQTGAYDASSVYSGILERVFHTTTGGGLRLYDMRGSDGEIGLKAAGSDDYFGVVNIGDAPAFRKLVEADNSGIAIEQDALHDSLFDRINDHDSTVEVLAGSRKFMEGWNSWRVSTWGCSTSEGARAPRLSSCSGAVSACAAGT